MDSKTSLLAFAALLAAGCHDLSYTAPCEINPSDPHCPGADAGDDAPGDAPADMTVDSATDAEDALDAPSDANPTCADAGACTPGTTQPATGTSCTGALEVATQSCTTSCQWGAPTCGMPKGWTKIADPPGGFAGRYGHSAVWTGKEMIVWGGRTAAGANLADGARYDPKTNTWTMLAPPPAGFLAREGHDAVWTGIYMVIFGGYTDGGWVGSAAMYSPDLGTWTPMTSAPVVASGSRQSAWLGTVSKMFTWASPSSTGPGQGAAFSFANSNWSSASSCAFCTGVLEVAVSGHGTTAFVWGGRDRSGNLTRTGATYDITSDTWTTLPSVPSSYADRMAPLIAALDDGFVITSGVQPGAALAGDALAWFASGWHSIPEASTPALSAAQHQFGTFWCRDRTCWLWGGLAWATSSFLETSSLVALDLAGSSWIAGPTSAGMVRARYLASVVDAGSFAILWGGAANPGADPTKAIGTSLADGAIFVP